MCVSLYEHNTILDRRQCTVGVYTSLNILWNYCPREKCATVRNAARRCATRRHGAPRCAPRAGDRLSILHEYSVKIGIYCFMFFAVCLQLIITSCPLLLYFDLFVTTIQQFVYVDDVSHFCMLW